MASTTNGMGILVTQVLINTLVNKYLAVPQSIISVLFINFGMLRLFNKEDQPFIQLCI